MPIENPKQFIKALTRTHDVGSEPDRGLHDILCTRKDGASIFFESNQDIDDKWEAIGLAHPGDDRFMFIYYGHEKGKTQVHVDSIGVGVLEIETESGGGLDHCCRFYRYKNGNWIKGPGVYVHPIKYKIWENSGMFFTQKKDLPPAIDLEATEKKFLAKVKGWLANRQSFDNASLKPELVLPTLNN